MGSNAVGFIFIEIFFILSIILGYGLLWGANLHKKFIIQAMILSAILHFIGAILYCYLSQYSDSDAIGYFYNSGALKSSLGFIGIGFLYHLVDWLRNLLFGDSYLGIYSFFAMIGFLGSLIYLILFNKLALELKYKQGFEFLTKKIKLFSLFIACWPSAMFWASNLGKDSLCYFLIALFFLSIFNLRYNLYCLLPLLISAVLFFLIRPYLFLVVFMGYILWLIFSKRHTHNIFFNAFLLLVLFMVFFSLYDFLLKLGGLETFNFNHVLNNVLSQQNLLSTGTHIPVPTDNPHSLIFFLPYTVLANLFLPLFILARNTSGFLASVENVVLVYLTISFFKHYNYWRVISETERLLGYAFWYFISGMIMLGLSNTNLGLASREKLMYLPLFLIIIFLTLAQNRTPSVAQRT